MKGGVAVEGQATLLVPLGRHMCQKNKHKHMDTLVHCFQLRQQNSDVTLFMPGNGEKQSLPAVWPGLAALTGAGLPPRQPTAGTCCLGNRRETAMAESRAPAYNIIMTLCG